MADEGTADTGHTQQPGRLSVISTTGDGVRVVTLSGEMDHHTGGPLCQALDAAPCRLPPRRGRHARRQLHGIHRHQHPAHRRRALSEAGGWLRLAAPTDPVMRALKIAGVATLLNCHETLHQALNARRP
jgi:stage II sporulation protein AA (anti-sigma F factor antagonist)